MTPEQRVFYKFFLHARNYGMKDALLASQLYKRMKLPDNIPIDKFVSEFNNMSIEGKIAVMEKFREVGYVYLRQTGTTTWMPERNPQWDWSQYDHNFPVEPKRTLVPWTKDTVPREAWIREKTKLTSEAKITVIGQTTAGIGNVGYGYKTLADMFEHSLDGGKTWLPCGTWKEEV